MTTFSIRLRSPDGLAIADTTDCFGQGVMITRINVPRAHRERGVGTSLLKQILSWADENQKTLFLDIQSSDGMTRDDLQSWYERHGFRDVGGMFRRSPG